MLRVLERRKLRQRGALRALSVAVRIDTLAALALLGSVWSGTLRRDIVAHIARARQTRRVGVARRQRAATRKCSVERAQAASVVGARPRRKAEKSDERNNETQHRSLKYRHAVSLRGYSTRFYFTLRHSAGKRRESLLSAGGAQLFFAGIGIGTGSATASMPGVAATRRTTANGTKRRVPASTS